MSAAPATHLPFVGGLTPLRDLRASEIRREHAQGPVPAHLVPGLEGCDRPKKELPVTSKVEAVPLEPKPWKPRRKRKADEPPKCSPERAARLIALNRSRPPEERREIGLRAAQTRLATQPADTRSRAASERNKARFAAMTPEERRALFAERIAKATASITPEQRMEWSARGGRRSRGTKKLARDLAGDAHDQR